MIYLDNGATTPPAEEVVRTYVQVSERYFANPASIHGLGVEANHLLERAREQVKQLLTVPNGEVIFTSGGTEANNLALIGYARANRKKGNTVLISSIEHASVREAAAVLKEEGWRVETIPVDEEGVVDWHAYERLLTDDVAIISVMHVNNEIGSVQPIRKMARLAREKTNAFFHTDTVQSFGKLLVTFDELEVDALTISGHKVNGMKGTGALVMRHRYPLAAIAVGGGQESGYRSGTVAVNGAVSLAKAMRLAAVEREREPFVEWKRMLLDACQSLETVRVLAPTASASHITALAFKNIRGEIALNHLQRDDIYVSTSSACSSSDGLVSHVIEAIAVPKDYRQGVIRISFGTVNTKSDIERLIESLQRLNDLIK
ncbi:aminotransferase class V-fold PLP-dependent enzyme [Planococcaceae bacterium Storch 2/2-2]|nr:aminotransferase class V-fold PLP-dependent enzyme [Planococcaceae bacterium Storch 2/2-2]